MTDPGDAIVATEKSRNLLQFNWSGDKIGLLFPPLVCLKATLLSVVWGCGSFLAVFLNHRVMTEAFLHCVAYQGMVWLNDETMQNKYLTDQQRHSESKMGTSKRDPPYSVKESSWKSLHLWEKRLLPLFKVILDIFSHSIICLCH